MNLFRRVTAVLLAASFILAACRPGAATNEPAATQPIATQTVPEETAAPAATVPATSAPAATATPDEPAFVGRMIEALIACATLSRNQACLGQGAVELAWHDGAEAQPFAQPGDVVDLTKVESLSLGGEAGNWGVAVLSLEAGLPDETQNLTILAMGPAELDLLDLLSEAGEPQWTIEPDDGEEVDPAALPDPLTFEPLQRLHLTSGAPAADGWPVGLLMWTPWEGGLATFELNGATIALGSTALVEANPAQGLTLATLEGTLLVTSAGNSGIVPGGGQTTVPTDADGTVNGPAETATAFDPRAEAIARAVAQYGVVPPFDPRAEAISNAVAQYNPELAEPDPWMDRVLIKAYANWLNRAARLCATLGGSRGARYVYNTLYWDNVLDRMGSDAYIDEVLGVGARARLDEAAGRCLTFELDFGSRSEAQAASVSYIIDLESEGLPLHFAPTGFLATADDGVITHVLYDVIGEDTKCPSELIAEDGVLQINGMWLRISVNTLKVGIDFLPKVPHEFIRYHCPVVGDVDAKLSWMPIFGGAYGEMVIPETGAIRFANWKVTQGEHFAETIEDRNLPVDGADVDITTYFVLVHTPIPPP